MKTKSMHVYWEDLSPVTIEVDLDRYVVTVITQAAKMLRTIHGDAFTGHTPYSLLRKADSMILSPAVKISEYLRPGDRELVLADYYKTTGAIKP